MGNGPIAALLCTVVLEAAFASPAASPIGQVLASPPSAFEVGGGNYADHEIAQNIIVSLAVQGARRSHGLARCVHSEASRLSAHLGRNPGDARPSWCFGERVTFNQPLGGDSMPRFAGPTTMMRLPAAATAAGVTAAFVGVPLDIATSNRPGARFGPREIRAQSCLLRPFNLGTGAAPFESFQVADLGDIAINTFNLTDSVRLIREAYEEILSHEATPLGIGG